MHGVKLKKACRDDKPFVWILRDHELITSVRSTSLCYFF